MCLLRGIRNTLERCDVPTFASTTGKCTVRTGTNPRPLLGLEWLKAHVGYQGDDCLTWPLSCDNYGYAQVGVGQAKVRKAYRVMCELAHGPAPTPEHEAAHSCGRGKFGCVHPGHLSWKTRSENALDSVQHGTHYKMKGVPRYKLNVEQVSEIRALGGFLTYPEIAVIYGVSHRNIGKIIRGVTWRHTRGQQP